MSSTSSAELAASRLDSKEPGCEQLHSVNASPTPAPCSQSTGLECRAIQTSANSQLIDSQQMKLMSTSSAVGSLAKTLVRPARVEALRVSEVASGKSSGALRPKSNQNSQSLKMYPHSEPVALSEWSGNLPTSGMTRNGQLFQRAQWVPHIHETGCSLWPTPRADGGNNAGGSNSRRAAIKRGTYITGKMYPNHREWLMGYQPGHTEIDASAMPSSRRSRKSSDERS